MPFVPSRLLHQNHVSLLSFHSFVILIFFLMFYFLTFCSKLIYAFILLFQREINEVFEQFKLSDGLHRSTLDSSNKLLPEKRNISASSDSKVNKIGSKLQENVQNEKVIKTAEWANTLLKELDNLMQSDKRRTAKSADHDVHLVEKNAAKCNILKPEKHVSQSILILVRNISSP